MEGNYRLFRQGGGRSAFAHVYVRVVSWDEIGSQVIVALDLSKQSTVLSGQDTEGVTAAIKGCLIGLQALQEIGIETKNYQVQIIQLITNLVDISPDAIQASAFLAIAQAFGVLDKFEVIFQEEWKVIPKPKMLNKFGKP